MKAPSLLLALSVLSTIASAAHAVDIGDFNIDIDKIIDTGEKVGAAMRDISPQEEMEIGSGMSAALLGAVPLVQDEAVQRYVNRVGRWCAGHAERPELPWHFAVLDTGTVNAFAAPGGYIFITRGLLGLVGSEAELAGVLSHEIAHVIARHHLIALKNQAVQGLLGNLASEALEQQQFDPAPFIQGGMDLFARGLDREDEFQADRMGVVVATRAGYEPYGLPRVLLTLNDLDPRADDLELLTSTHPPTLDRLGRLEQLMLGRFERFGQQPLVTERYAENVGGMFPPAAEP